MARTDDDTWDLASSVGATATMVAAARAMASKTEQPLINDPFAEPLVRAVGLDLFTPLARPGLRARPARCPGPAGPTVYEVDQPQVIEFKSRTLAELGAEPTAYRRAV